MTAATPTVSPSAEVDHLVVMGVSGSGKSTVAALLAERLGREFGEGDLFHSEANRAKMSKGVALEDADRAPWLASLRDWMTGHYSSGRLTVLACSALRRRYRDVLREAGGSVTVAHLMLPAEVAADRMRQRGGHYMPLSLLTSQLNTLEPLEPDEPGVTLDGTAPLGQLVEDLVVTLTGARPRS
jgi:gluconokinase